MKVETYDGRTLRWARITLKVDGVRVHRAENGVVSREGKPLYNVTLPEGCDVAEVFCGSWEASVSAVRTQNGVPVPSEHVYPLQPFIDYRLIVGTREELRADEVKALFDKYSAQYEGLVLWAEGRLFKVKGKETYDVPVTDVIPGKGKHTGRMGALMTTMGKVGTGFTDAQRSMPWAPGMVVEVECMALTPGGKFRHPRFLRRREDKET